MGSHNLEGLDNTLQERERQTEQERENTVLRLIHLDCAKPRNALSVLLSHVPVEEPAMTMVGHRGVQGLLLVQRQFSISSLLPLCVIVGEWEMKCENISCKDCQNGVKSFAKTKHCYGQSA